MPTSARGRRRVDEFVPIRVPRRAVRVAILDPSWSVFLLRYDNVEVGVHWAMPGGGIEDGESLLEAARGKCSKRQDGRTSRSVRTSGPGSMTSRTRGDPSTSSRRSCSGLHHGGNPRAISLPTSTSGSLSGDGGTTVSCADAPTRCGRRSCRHYSISSATTGRRHRRSTFQAGRSPPSILKRCVSS